MEKRSRHNEKMKNHNKEYRKKWEKNKKNKGMSWHQQGAYHIKWGSGTDEMPSEMMKKVGKE